MYMKNVEALDSTLCSSKSQQKNVKVNVSKCIGPHSYISWGPQFTKSAPAYTTGIRATKRKAINEENRLLEII